MKIKMLTLSVLFAAAGVTGSAAAARPAATDDQTRRPVSEAPAPVAAKKWKDCTYDSKGHVTNAPCTGVRKDDKGTTWWP